MAVGVTIWHAPLFVMPQFGSSPIEAGATVAVTFWYAWLFDHASGSSLLTLIAHASEGAIEVSTVWSERRRHDPDALAVHPGLGSLRGRPAGLRPRALDEATGTGGCRGPPSRTGRVPHVTSLSPDDEPFHSTDEAPGETS